ADGGGRGEEGLQDPHGTTRHGAPAVLFEVELAFEGLIDRFDALPYRTQQATTRPCLFTAVRGSHDRDTPVVEPVFGVAVAVALVHHQNQPIRVVEHVRLHTHQVNENLTFVGLGVGQGERHRQTMHGGDQV